MNIAKFWFVQIMLLAIISLAFGPSAIAAPKSKGIETATAEATEEVATHGEEMRLDKANLENGNADWKSEDTTPPDPSCSLEVGPSFCYDPVECDALWGNGSWNSTTNSCDA